MDNLLTTAQGLLDIISSDPGKATVDVDTHERSLLGLLEMLCGNKSNAQDLLRHARDQHRTLASMLEELRPQWEPQAERDRCALELDDLASKDHLSVHEHDNGFEIMFTDDELVRGGERPTGGSVRLNRAEMIRLIEGATRLPGLRDHFGTDTS